MHAEKGPLIFRHSKVLSEENEYSFHTNDINKIEEGLYLAQIKNTACSYVSLSSIPTIRWSITNPHDVSLDYTLHLNFLFLL